MTTFYAWNNRDKADTYTKTLLEAGYTLQEDYGADFLLIDYERRGGVQELEKYKKPIFIYPHSAISDILWDGLYKQMKVTCNFVIGTGQRRVMEKYGYQYKTLVCGWPYGNVLNFLGSSGQRLLFAPVHPNASVVGLTDLDKKANREAMVNILDNRKLFKSIKVRYGRGLEENGLGEFEKSGVIFEKSDLRFASAKASIIESDVVISFGTFGYLSVSMGKPTIFYGQTVVPHNMQRSVKSFDKYKDYRYFPVDLSQKPIKTLVNSVRKRNEQVEEWKKLFIGNNFDKRSFLWEIAQHVK